MKKLLSVIFALLVLQSSVWATIWTASYSGSLTSGNTTDYSVVFPGPGTLTISFHATGTTGVITATLLHSGTTVVGGSSSSTTTVTLSAVQVVGSDTYTLRMSCPYGSNGYSVSLSLNYIANFPPVISSITASPTTGVYGTPITVSVSATDPDNNLSYVRFVNGSVSVDDNTSPYSQVYQGSTLIVGAYTITAYAVDTQAASDDAVVQFTITQRPITVGAKGGSSTYGTMPTGQGLELVSGTLVNGDSLSSLGLTTSQTINSSTPAGTYTINVLGSPSNYSVTRVSGSWTVINAINGCIDSDNDGIPDRIEIILCGNLTTLSSINQIKGNADGDLYSRLIELLGGSNDTTYTSGSWAAANAPGSALGSGVLVVTSQGACFSVNVSNLTLNPLN
jgi:hypothetical protein